MENTQLSSKNNLFTGNIYQNNDTCINILHETEFLKQSTKNGSVPIILSNPCTYIIILNYYYYTKTIFFQPSIEAYLFYGISRP